MPAHKSATHRRDTRTRVRPRRDSGELRWFVLSPRVRVRVPLERRAESARDETDKNIQCSHYA